MEKNSFPISHEHSLTMDYVKAFGMIFVLVGHINNDIFNVYYAYLFHMPLFFFIGGVLYKDTRCITNFTAHVIKKTVTLSYSNLFDYWFYCIIN